MTPPLHCYAPPCAALFYVYLRHRGQQRGPTPHHNLYKLVKLACGAVEVAVVVVVVVEGIGIALIACVRSVHVPLPRRHLTSRCAASLPSVLATLALPFVTPLPVQGAARRTFAAPTEITGIAQAWGLLSSAYWLSVRAAPAQPSCPLLEVALMVAFEAWAPSRNPPRLRICHGGKVPGVRG